MGSYYFNGNDDYIVLKRDIYNNYGFIKGMILQYMANSAGEFVGSVGSFSKVVDVASVVSVRSHLKELINDGIISKERISQSANRYLLTELGKESLSSKCKAVVKEKKKKEESSVKEWKYLTKEEKKERIDRIRGAIKKVEAMKEKKKNKK